LSDLTAREREVLASMAQGKNNAAIAEALTLTPRAVEKHINAIFSKLPLDQARDVDRRVTAVLLFLADDS
jgi:DNA-binding NarL/FixJ family response regulator